MDEKKPLVVVLTRSYSTGLAVVRSLGAAGYTVDLVASAYKKGKTAVAACSKYVNNFVEVVSAKVKDPDEEDPLLDELLEYAGRYEEKPVLFPTDDFTTSVMDQNRSLLEPIFVMPHIVGGGDGSITERMDKTFQAGLAEAAGLLIPQEWIISLREEYDEVVLNEEEIAAAAENGETVEPVIKLQKRPIEIPEDMVYPCFVKPIESVSGYKKEMAVCNDEKQLRKHLKKLRKNFADRSILVQEFLKIDNEIDLSGVCLDQEIIIPAIIKKLNVARYERGVTLAGRVVSFDEIAQIKENIISMMKQFHYVGMFDMELNIVGDKIYFNEVNLRSGGPNYAYYMSGVNLPALFVKEVLGEKHTPEEEQIKTLGQSFIYEKVAWEDHMHGYLTRKELDERIASADIRLLCNDDDPEPGKLFVKTMELSVLNQKRKKAKAKFDKKYKKFKRTLRKITGPIRRPLKKIFKKIKKGVHKIARKVKPVLRHIKYFLLGYPQSKKENVYKPLAEKPRVVVAGRNYCSNLCMARSLGEAGYEVEVLRVFQVKPKWYDLMKILKPDAYSKYVKKYHICVTNRKPKTLVKKLTRIADPYRRKLLIPADDLVANIADENFNKLSRYYILPNVNHEENGINRLMSKEVQKEIAREFGLPVVNSHAIRTQEGKFKIPEEVTYPCFIKPDISKNSSKSRMKKCESAKELKDTLRQYSRRKDVEILVEDFLDIKREYAILGVSTKHGVVAPGYFGALEGGHKERRGVAMTGQILPVSDQQELIDNCIRFVESLNFEGLFDIDLIETTDGKMYFVELNLRFGASGYAVTQSGVNLPGMYADYMALGKPIDLDCQVEAGKCFISEKVMLEEYMHGFLTKPEMMQRHGEVDVHFVMNELDPKPYKHFKKFYPVAALAKKAFKIKEH